MEVFRSTMDVNYFGVVNTLKAAVPRMVERGEGQVVIVASVMAIIGTCCPAPSPNVAALASLFILKLKKKFFYSFFILS